MATRDILTDLNMGSASRITNLLDGTDPQHPATIAQLNAAVEGLAWKDSARVSTQANINLAAPGASIDGITMAASDRFLARAQTSSPENGIYVWNGAATAATRATDASTFAELESAVVSVEEGTDAGLVYRQTAVNGVIGTNDVLFVVFGTSVPDASDTVKGKVELATTAETTTGTDTTRAVTPAGLAGSVWAAKRYAVAFGDGAATSYTITHNLASDDVLVQVYRNSGNKDTVEVEVRRPTTNTVQLVLNVAPTSNQFRCIVLA